MYIIDIAICILEPSGLRAPLFNVHIGVGALKRKKTSYPALAPGLRRGGPCCLSQVHGQRRRAAPQTAPAPSSCISSIIVVGCQWGCAIYFGYWLPVLTIGVCRKPEVAYIYCSRRSWCTAGPFASKYRRLQCVHSAVVVQRNRLRFVCQKASPHLPVPAPAVSDIYRLSGLERLRLINIVMI